MNKELKNYEVLVRALEGYSLVNLDINVLRKGENVFKKIKESTASEWPLLPYLSFIEENDKSFTLKTANSTKNWDGALEYSTDAENWSEWNGGSISSSNDGKLYLRGTGNSRITNSIDTQFVLTNNRRIQCVGNIENLLDYETVAQGKHPQMASWCYKDLFKYCISLTSAPSLPATTLKEYCYTGMFQNCTSLTRAPRLPATTLADCCYSDMFASCISLTKAPRLPATTLGLYCYSAMFQNCKSLTGAIHCPATTANDSNRLDATARIPVGTAIVVYDL